MAATLSTEIGEKYAGASKAGASKSPVDFVAHKAAHAIIGAATAKALGQDVATGALGAVVAETVAEVHQSGASERALEKVYDTAKREGRAPTQADFQKAYQGEIKTGANLGKMAAATSAFVAGKDVNTAHGAGSTAVDNNFVATGTLLALTVASTAWAAYDVAQTYETQGPEAALKQLGYEVAAIAALGGAGKVVLKGGKLAAPVLKKAWEAALAKSPILKFTVGKTHGVAMKVKMVSRTPKTLQDKMTLDAAKKGKGRSLENITMKDPRFKGMEKWEYKTKSKQKISLKDKGPQGYDTKDSVVHYVKDPKTGKTMDFKFKKHSHE